MARRNQRVRVGSSDVEIGTGVHAPSSIAADDSAARNAEMLQRALGLGVDAFAKNRQRNLDEGAKAGALSVQQGGATEQTLSAIGTPENARAAGWVLGAERELARTRAIQDEGAIVEWYQTVDKTLPLPELRDQLNQKMASLYGGADPGVARIAAPFLKRAADRIMATHAETQAAQVRSEVERSLAINMGEFLSRPVEQRSQEEWEGRRQVYTQLLGVDGVARLAGDVATAAVNAKDERLLDEPMFAHLRTNPKTRDLLDSAYAEAKRIRLHQRELDESYDAAVTYEVFLQRAAAKDESLLEDLQSAMTPDKDGLQLINQGQGQSILHALYDTSSKETLSPQMKNYWSSGLFAKYGDEKWEDEAAKASVAEYAELHGPEAAAHYLVDRSIVNGRLPPFVEQELSRADPSNAQTWPQAVDRYRQFEAQAPGWLDNELPEHAVRQYEAYLQLEQDFGPQGAAERLADYDPALVKEVTRDERDDAFEVVFDDVTDVDWSWNNIEDSPQVRRMVNSTFDYMVGLGYTPEKAAEHAIARITRSTVAVDGHLFPANAGWGHNPTAVADFIKAEYAIDHQYDIDDIEIVPIPSQPTHVRVRSLNSPSSLNVPLRDAVGRWEASEREKANVAQEAQRSQTRATQLENVKKMLFGEALYMSPLGLSAREQKWNSLSASEQNAAIDRYVDLARIEERARLERKALRDQAQSTIVNSNY